MRIAVKVHPRARRNKVSGGPAEYKVEVTAPPVDGAANDAVIQLLADEFRVRRSEVRIITGENARRKIVEIPGL